MTKRNEELLTIHQKFTILDLHHVHGLSFETIGERYSLDKMAVRDVIGRARRMTRPDNSTWRVTWLDDAGERHEKRNLAFEDARSLAATVDADKTWFVGTKTFKTEANAMSFAKLTGQASVILNRDVKIRR